MEEVEIFRKHFEKEIKILADEKTYKTKIQDLLQLYFENYDDSEVRAFLGKEVKDNGWEIYNHLFIRKAIDLAMDKSPNEREACSKLLVLCTQDYRFSNPDYGYAFDFFVWVISLSFLIFVDVGS